MLEIISPEGISLDLPEDIAIEMEFNNPLFAEAELVGDYSLSFKLDATDTNKKAFNFVDRIEGKQRLSQKYEGYKIAYGNTFLKGSLVVVELPYKKFEVRFNANVGVFKNVMDKLIGANDFSDFDFDFKDSAAPNGNILLSDLTAFLKNELAAGTSQYAKWPKWVPFTVYTPDLGVWDKFEDHINIYYDNFPNGFFDPSGDFNTNSWNAFLSLYPSVRFILERICEENGYTFDADIFDLDSELTKLMLFTNYLTVINYTPFSDSTNANNPWLMAVALPQVNCNKFIVEFAKLFCQALFISENKRTVVMRDKITLLNDRSYIEMTDFVSPEINQLANDYNGFELKYAFGNDDEFVNEEFKEFDASTALPSVPTLIDLPTGTPGDIRLIEKGNFYVIRKPSGWEFYTHNYVAKKVDGGGNRIEFGLTPLFMYSGPDLYADRYYPGTPRDFTVPKVKTKGFGFANFYFDEERLTSTEDTRIVYYRGMDEDSNGNPYPFASSDKYDTSGNDVYNNCLRIDDEKGIWKRWKQYTEWRKNSKRVELFAKLNADLLFNPQKYYQNMWRVNDVNFRIRNIQVTLYKYRIGLAKVKAYTAY